MLVGNRKTVLPWHAYGDGSEKLTWLPKKFVKRKQFQLLSTRTNSAVWPVPYTCAQPYHPGSGSHRQLFVLISTYQHGIAPGERSHLRASTPPFTAEARAKSTPLSGSSDAMLMIPNKDETAVHGCHCKGDMVVRMCKVLAIPQSWYAVSYTHLTLPTKRIV